MTTLSLVDPTDARLDGAFAEHVIKLPMVSLEWGTGPTYWYRLRASCDGVGNLMESVPRVTQSVDSVLPYLDDWPHWSIGNCDAEDGKRVVVTLYQLPKTGGYEKVSDAVVKGGVSSLARAMVVALLRAKGVEITFS